jgi:regulator of sirC expression with transglutaminase-like and TPR domain
MTSPEPGTAWEFLREAPDDEIPLVWGALTIARDEYPDLDVALYEQRIAHFGDRARSLASAGRDPVDAVRTLNSFLFDELGFSGNQADYYDPRNSYLNEVVERRLGIPISLGLIQMDVARQLGLTLHGVSFPGHFLVSLPVDGGLLVLDPYHKGRSLDAQELKKRAQPHVGDVELKDDQLSELLTPASNRAILTRMLRNLKALYTERDDFERALRCTDRLLVLDAEQPSELRDRGLLYLRIGHLNAGREDLAKYLNENPTASDADQRDFGPAAVALSRSRSSRSRPSRRRSRGRSSSRARRPSACRPRCRPAASLPIPCR